MASVRFTDVQSHPTEFLDCTSLTLDEFQQLVPPFEAAFQAHMAAWRLDGTPRTARRFAVYKNCPLATPEDRLFFILTYLKTYALQVVHGRLFGMGQSKVAYLLAADNVLRPLPCPLIGGNQPVMRPRNRFSRPRPALLACNGTHLGRSTLRCSKLPPVLRPSAAGATAVPESTTPLAATTHGPSSLPPSPAYRAATP